MILAVAWRGEIAWRPSFLFFWCSSSSAVIRHRAKNQLDGPAWPVQAWPGPKKSTNERPKTDPSWAPLLVLKRRGGRVFWCFRTSQKKDSARDGEERPGQPPKDILPYFCQGGERCVSRAQWSHGVMESLCKKTMPNTKTAGDCRGRGRFLTRGEGGGRGRRPRPAASCDI